MLDRHRSPNPWGESQGNPRMTFLHSICRHSSSPYCGNAGPSAAFSYLSSKSLLVLSCYKTSSGLSAHESNSMKSAKIVSGTGGLNLLSEGLEQSCRMQVTTPKHDIYLADRCKNQCTLRQHLSWRSECNPFPHRKLAVPTEP